MVYYNTNLPGERRRKSEIAPKQGFYAKPRQRPGQKKEPFDPDDLRRRLYMVLADQNIQEDRRRRLMGEENERSGKESPSVAAAAAGKVASATGAKFLEKIAEDTSETTKEDVEETSQMPIDTPPAASVDDKKREYAIEENAESLKEKAISISSIDGDKDAKRDIVPLPSKEVKEPKVRELKLEMGPSRGESPNRNQPRNPVPVVRRRASKSFRERLDKARSSRQFIPQEPVVEQTRPTYRHVPQEAAKQFSRTATSSKMRREETSHNLSLTALRMHIECPDEDHEQVEAAIKTIRRQSSMAEILREREMRLHSRTLEWCTEVEEARGKTKARRGLSHIFEDEEDFRRKSSNISKISKTSGVGSGYGVSEGTVDVVEATEHRIDWTQKDEIHRKQPAQPVQKAPPRLRKRNSIMILRAKLSTLTRHQVKEIAIVEEKDGTPSSSSPISPKSPRLGFFARFRH